jgi:hypothetical protein
MNKTPTPLSANDLSNHAQPTTLYITQGSFGIMSTVELRGDTLYFSAASYSEEEAIGRLNPERWHTFRQTLESLQAAQWQPIDRGQRRQCLSGRARPRLHDRRRAIAGLAALYLCGDLVDGRPLEPRRAGAVGRGGRPSRCGRSDWLYARTDRQD